jgi:hypothetical protein
MQRGRVAESAQAERGNLKTQRHHGKGQSQKLLASRKSEPESSDLWKGFFLRH